MPKIWAYTSLTQKDALVLVINDLTYDVSQFSHSFALNELPTASCLVAVGHKATRGRLQQLARIHETAESLKQMLKAQVYFHPKGEYTPGGVRWPEGRVLIWDGYVAGLAPRKNNGKIYVLINLFHWLIDLAFSSALNAISHSANPAQMTAAAVLPTLQGRAGGAPAPLGVNTYLSSEIGIDILSPSLGADLWGTVRTFFLNIAGIPAARTAPIAACEGEGDWTLNTRAINALKRIEPFQAIPDIAAGRDPERQYSAPLAFDTLGINQIEVAIARAISMETVMSYAGTTFWDKLIGTYCPMFGMALVPRVDTALVVADVPGYRRVYRTIDNVEYDDQEFTSQIDTPLRGVGVTSGYEQDTGAAISAGVPLPIIGGCYLSDAERDAGGVIRYIQGPIWLSRLLTSSVFAGANTGLALGIGSGSELSPDSAVVAGVGGILTAVRLGEMQQLANQLFSRYAHSVFVQQMLRGRVGVISGKLRFDIAPGSSIRVIASRERHIRGVDELAQDVIANVLRVTSVINAEASTAGTAYQLGYFRTEKENTEDRTSVDRHPLFGNPDGPPQTAIHGNGTGGCPLVDAYAFP